MDVIRDVLVQDARGKPSTAHRLVASSEWDDIRLWSDKVYMPYTVTPIGKARRPDSVLDATQIGHFTLSRFKYGIPVNIKDFSPETGTGMVLTTLRGSARHWSGARAFSDTGVGETFVVDNTRTHYWVDFDPDHLQVNLTFEHDELASLHERWFGEPADERLWLRTFRMGGAGSPWISLLAYVCQCITHMPEAVSDGPLGRHLEEVIGVHLLTQWRAQLAQPSDQLEYRLAPRHVLAAERHIRENARLAPTLSELATVAGVSVRCLSQGFREYRRCTPMDALREQRLQGVRAELLMAGPGATVQSIAADWGFANMGYFAKIYRQRFNELPASSLRNHRLT
ncbi:helix-turn-helix transcriptional regulator [Hydrogenophaga sp. 5NK40-0174]|uniref:AraC family transcriptional regulator n=1 Tax=Hydrogenophaga sp. 5NK40-0174 TaxID=3127649 RepID=UPI003105A215